MAKKKSKFDETFSEVVPFTPNGYYISKNIFTKEEALKKFLEYTKRDDINISEIEDGFVRFQRTPEDLREEGVLDMAWITCRRTDRNAQSCWVYDL